MKNDFNRVRVKVRATLDCVDYFGSMADMGLKRADGLICYIIGITKAIQKRIGKGVGDQIDVTITKNLDGCYAVFFVSLTTVIGEVIVLQLKHERCHILDL